MCILLFFYIESEIIAFMETEKYSHSKYLLGTISTGLTDSTDRKIPTQGFHV